MRHLPSHLRSHLQRHNKKYVDYERLGCKPRQRALVVTMILVQMCGPCGPRSARAHDIVVKPRHAFLCCISKRKLKCRFKSRPSSVGRSLAVLARALISHIV